MKTTQLTNKKEDPSRVKESDYIVVSRGGSEVLSRTAFQIYEEAAAEAAKIGRAVVTNIGFIRGKYGDVVGLSGLIRKFKVVKDNARGVAA